MKLKGVCGTEFIDRSVDVAGFWSMIPRLPPLYQLFADRQCTRDVVFCYHEVNRGYKFLTDHKRSLVFKMPCAPF